MSTFIEAKLADRLAQQQLAESNDAATILEGIADDTTEADVLSLAKDEDGSEENADNFEVVIEDSTPNDQSEAAPRVILAYTGDPACAKYCNTTFDDFSLSIDANRFYATGYQETLIQLIEHCVIQEDPIRDDILARRIGAAHGFQRTGNRIRDHVGTIARRICRSTREDVGRFSGQRTLIQTPG